MHKCLLFAFLFISLSPLYVAQWTSINTNAAGNSLQNVYFADTYTGWAVGQAGTILKTETAAKSWTRQNSGVSSDLLTIHFYDVNTGYAAGAGGTLLKTTDGGDNWMPITSSAASDDIIYVHCFAADNVVLIDKQGIMRKSVNGGADWTSVNTAAGTADAAFFATTDTGWVISSTCNLSVTVDGGQTWTSIFNSQLSGRVFRMHFSDNLNGWMAFKGSYYSAFDDNIHRSLLLKTVDGGLNWSVSTFSGNVMDHYTDVFFLNNSTGWFVQQYDITAHRAPDKDNRNRISSSDLYSQIKKTTNGGTSWELVTTRKFPPVKKMWASDDKMICGVGDDGCIILDDMNSEGFYPAFTGTFEDFKSISFKTREIGYSTGVYANENPMTSLSAVARITTDGGVTWNNLQNSYNFQDHPVIYAVTPNTLLWADYEHLWKSTDAGSTWTQLPNSPTNIMSICFADELNGWVCGDKLARTSDGGASWNLQNTSVTDTYNSVWFVDNNTGWAAGSGGNIYKTTDGGGTWNTAVTGTANTLRSIHFAAAQTGYAVGDAGTVLKSINGGDTWQTLSVPVSVNLNSVVFLNNSTGWIAGNNGTLMGTTNGGASWDLVATGTTYNFTSLNFVDASTGYASGYEGILLKYSGTDVPEHFAGYSAQGEIYNIVIDQASIEGLPLSNGDEIAVYDNGPGGSGLIGAAVYHADQIPMIVTSYLRTEFNSEVIPGAIRGNEISFRIWDSSAGKEYSASAVFQRGEHFGDMPSSLVSSLKADITYQLYISEVTDPFDQFSARYVELYNSGNTSINFDDEVWYLSRQANGGTTWNEVRLTKSILPGETYLVAVDTANFHKYYGFSADIGIPGSAGNGDDAYYLYKNGGRTTGLLVDIYGEANTDGTGKAWEYTDSRSVRRHDITAASAIWNSSEWKRYFPLKLNCADMTPREHPETEETRFIASAGQYSFDKEPTGLEIVVKNISGSDSVTVKHQRGQITDIGPGVPEDYAVSSYRWFIEKRSGITGIVTELRFLYGRLAEAGIEEGATDIYLYKRSVKNTGNYTLVCPLLYFNNGTMGDQSDDYVYCDNISEFSEFVIVSPSQALPVELTAFSAVQTGQNILLSWQTQTEMDNYGYEIERKSAQADWTKIAFIKGNGTTNKVSDYSYVDNIEGQSSWVSYRLKQVDLSGNYRYYTENRVVLNSPARYVLEQNYPNPFNPETNISFSMPADQNVRIFIYNQLGELVESLLDGPMKAGYHTITWRPEGLATGVYYVRLTAGDYISVRKVLYLK